MKQLKITIAGEVKTFDLPENGEYKCEVAESYVPKAGDCVRVGYRGESLFHWFKIAKIGTDYADFDFGVNSNLEVLIEGHYSISDNVIYTKITTEELKAKYAEAGYDWDYDTDTIKPIRWIPKDGDEVWYLSIQLETARFLFNEDDYFNKTLLEKGLLFPTEEECQKFADHCWEFIHKKNK